MRPGRASAISGPFGHPHGKSHQPDSPTPTATTSNPFSKDGEDAQEDDYMTMTFTDDPPPTRYATPETSLQRARRLRKEGKARGRIKSKVELAAEEKERREAALSRSLVEEAASGMRASKGFNMMAKMGFRAGEALGKKWKVEKPGKTREKEGNDRQCGGGGGGEAPADEVEMDETPAITQPDHSRPSRGTCTPLTEPLRPRVRTHREGIGHDEERKRRTAEAEPPEAVKRPRIDPGEYRDRVCSEHEDARLLRMVHAAQKVAEGLDSSRCEDDGRDMRPAVEWRGLLRARKEAERDRRLRQGLAQGLREAHLGVREATERLPVYEPGQEEEDADDQLALGRGLMSSGAYSTTVVEAGDDEQGGIRDGEDQELTAFEALEPGEKLQRVVAYLRREHRYCFWCKYKYPDEKMEGCPGVSEADHD